jgi:hypothetical protein
MVVPQAFIELRNPARRESVEVQSSVPIYLSFTLRMAEVTTTLEVGASLALIDTDPSAHTDTNSAAI